MEGGEGKKDFIISKFSGILVEITHIDFLVRVEKSLIPDKSLVETGGIEPRPFECHCNALYSPIYHPSSYKLIPLLTTLVFMVFSLLPKIKVSL